MPDTPSPPTPATAAAVPAPHADGGHPPVVLRTLALAAPLQWLRLGWRDFVRAPGIGLFYGLCFMVMGWALLAMFEYSPAYVLALLGGFLLVGPYSFLAGAVALDFGGKKGSAAAAGSAASAAGLASAPTC